MNTEKPINVSAVGKLQQALMSLFQHLCRNGAMLMLISIFRLVDWALVRGEDAEPA